MRVYRTKEDTHYVAIDTQAMDGVFGFIQRVPRLAAVVPFSLMHGGGDDKGTKIPTT